MRAAPLYEAGVRVGNGVDPAPKEPTDTPERKRITTAGVFDSGLRPFRSFRTADPGDVADGHRAVNARAVGKASVRP
ncbi:hypothetical protein ACWDA7_44790 [Streptomyces sp. NPDC001156]